MDSRNKGLVSYVIANYNRKEHLRKCLFSILNQTYKNSEIIVIDNGSSDGSIEMLEREFIEVKLIKNNKNLMFAKAYNQGIKISKGEYVICLNNDIILESNFTLSALTKFKQDQKIGAVAGKLINPYNLRIDSCGQMLSLSRRAYERGYKKRDRGQFSEGYIWGIPGACGVYKKEMLENIKLDQEYFDETYNAYLEDLDLNWRINKSGWKVYYTPKAIAYHHRGITGWDNNCKFGYLSLSPELKAQFIRNRYSTLIKNESLSDFIKHLPFIISYDIYLWFFLLYDKAKLIIEFTKMSSWLKDSFRKRKLILEKKNFRREKWGN